MRAQKSSVYMLLFCLIANITACGQGRKTFASHLSAADNAESPSETSDPSEDQPPASPASPTDEHPPASPTGPTTPPDINPPTDQPVSPNPGSGEDSSTALDRLNDGISKFLDEIKQGATSSDGDKYYVSLTAPIRFAVVPEAPENVPSNGSTGSAGATGSNGSTGSTGRDSSSSELPPDLQPASKADEMASSLKDIISKFISDTKAFITASVEARTRSPRPRQAIRADGYPFRTSIAERSGERLAQAWRYESLAKSQLQPSDPDVNQKTQLLLIADRALNLSDEQFMKGNRSEGEFNVILATRITDAVIGAAPNQPTGATYLALTGIDSATGKAASQTMQAAAVVFTSTAICAETAAITGATITVAGGVALIALAAKSIETIAKDLSLLKNDILLIAAAMADEEGAAIAQEEGDRAPSTPVGHKGRVAKVPDGTNVPTEINGREYTGHALDRMQERGYVPSVVEDAIQHGRSEPGKEEGTIDYFSPNVTKVVTSLTGRVITIF